LLKEADVVLVMTPSHKAEIVAIYPQYEDKVFLLKEYGRKRRYSRDNAIADPYGGTKETYEVCFLRLQREAKRILPEFEQEVKTK
jgi:protein-tyrosine-phosphatase